MTKSGAKLSVGHALRLNDHTPCRDNADQRCAAHHHFTNRKVNVPGITRGEISDLVGQFALIKQAQYAFCVPYGFESKHGLLGDYHEEWQETAQDGIAKQIGNEGAQSQKRTERDERLLDFDAVADSQNRPEENGKNCIAQAKKRANHPG